MGLATDVWAAPPRAHAGGIACFALSLPTLRWLEATVQRTMRTLETGCGASTVIFAASGARHTTIAPDPFEFDAVQAYCSSNGIDAENVEFVAEPSHLALPRQTDDFDLILLDGAHGFPYPVLDWWYGQQRLKTGGLMLLDDSFVPAVGTVVRYLRRCESWEFVGVEGDRTTIFRKLSDESPSFHQGHMQAAGVSFRYLPLRRRLSAAVKHSVTERVPGALRLRRRLGELRRARARP